MSILPFSSAQESHACAIEASITCLRADHMLVMIAATATRERVCRTIQDARNRT
jgi:hypothetical protein